MKKFLIPFYRDYYCIAGDCPANCCSRYHIYFFKKEQEVFDSKPEWQNTDGRGTPIRDCVTDLGDGTEIKRVNGSCILLQNNLCLLQRLYNGEEALPSVCRTFPRLITRLPDRIEFALDPCCPVVMKLAEDWKGMAVEAEGDGPEPDDEEFLKRKRAFELLADGSLSLTRCLRAISSEYDAARTIPEITLGGKRLEFVRKAMAVMMWAYLIPYKETPNVENMAGYCIDQALAFCDFLKDREDISWWDMCLEFTALMDRSQETLDFDREIEETFVDSMDESL